MARELTYSQAPRENNRIIFIEYKLLCSAKGKVPEGEYLIPLLGAIRQGVA
jgi:hypothetical protein